MLNNQLSLKDVFIKNYWFGAKNKIKPEGMGHSHLLLQLDSSKKHMYVPHSFFSLKFPQGEILPLAIEDKIRSLSKLKSYILNHPIHATNQDENVIAKVNVIERWSKEQITQKTAEAERVLVETKDYDLALDKLFENVPLEIKIHRLKNSISYLKLQYERLSKKQYLANYSIQPQHNLASFKEFLGDRVSLPENILKIVSENGNPNLVSKYEEIIARLNIKVDG